MSLEGRRRPINGKMGASISACRFDLKSFRVEELCDEFLASLDIAEVNLRCAQGLSGTEELDIAACLDKIDEYAETVRHATSMNVPLFTAQPQRFDYSLGKFYMAVLCTTLQRECGVAYNPALEKNPDDGRRAEDQFIHGITHGPGGTCATLPVLYAAVGRRRGYPLKLVQGSRHLFLRWDESGSTSTLARDRFNIETTAKGFVSEPDGFYLGWPFSRQESDEKRPDDFKSLTPRQELAMFLGARSAVLMDAGKFVQAIQPAAWARRLLPDELGYQFNLERVMLLALGLLSDPPPWLAQGSVIGPDGVLRHRHWWPQKVNNPELLPAAKLPRELLLRLLPDCAEDAPLGALGDALYAQADLYADQARIEQYYEAAVHEQRMAEVMLQHKLNRARYEAMLEAPLAGQRALAALAGLPMPQPLGMASVPIAGHGNSAPPPLPGGSHGMPTAITHHGVMARHLPHSPPGLPPSMMPPFARPSVPTPKPGQPFLPWQSG